MNTTRKQRFSTVLIFGLALSLTLLQSRAASFSLNPTGDAFVTTGPTGNLSGNNYGGAGAISVSAPGLSHGEFQSVLQFDLSGAKTSFDTQFGAGQWSIQSISLQLTTTSPNNAIFNSSAAGQFGISWMQNDSWLEGSGTPMTPTNSGITFSSLSSFLSPSDESLATFSFNGATSGGNVTYTLGLTSSFLADVLAGNAVSLRLLATDSAVSGLFDSRNFTTASVRPLLTITLVPEPGAFALAVFGLCLCVGRRLFRHKPA